MQLEVKNEKGNHGWFASRLLKPLLGIWVIPIFVVTIDGEIKVEATRQKKHVCSAGANYLLTLTHSSSWMAHGRPSDELTIRSTHTSTLVILDRRHLRQQHGRHTRTRASTFHPPQSSCASGSSDGEHRRPALAGCRFLPASSTTAAQMTLVGTVLQAAHGVSKLAIACQKSFTQ